MITSAGRVIAALFLSALITSCAEGTNLIESLGDGGTVTPQPMCGNGMIETGEMCECMAGATGQCVVQGKDCSALGAGTGTLLCDPTTCMFVDDMCHNGSSGSGGSGGSGNGGTEG